MEIPAGVQIKIINNNKYPQRYPLGGRWLAPVRPKGWPGRARLFVGSSLRRGVRGLEVSDLASDRKKSPGAGHVDGPVGAPGCPDSGNVLSPSRGQGGRARAPR